MEGSQVTSRALPCRQTFAKTPKSTNNSGVIATLPTSGVLQSLVIEGEAGDFTFFHSVDVTPLALVVGGYISGEATFGVDGPRRGDAEHLLARSHGAWWSPMSATVSRRPSPGTARTTLRWWRWPPTGSRAYAYGTLTDDGAITIIDVLTGEPAIRN